MIYTVFPENPETLPQDFSTFEEAKEYAENYVDGKYVIESTDGECV